MRIIFDFRHATLAYYPAHMWLFGARRYRGCKVAIDVGPFRLYLGRGW